MIQPVHSIPTEWYVDPEMLRHERQHVFAPNWHYVGSAGAVRDPGTFQAVSLGDIPVVVTRDTEGVLRAFANVCRHRGSIITEGCGVRKTLQCGYHGWTYNLDGSLRNAPGVDVSPEAGQLPEFAVGTVGGMLFVSANADAAPLDGVMAPWVDLTRTISGVAVESFELRRSIPHDIAANWKVVAENFMECYHCPLIHGDTLPGYVADDGYIVTEYDSIVTHELESDRFSWANVFPNTQLSCFGNHGVVIARQLVPSGTGRTVVTLDYWFDPARTDEQEAETVEWFEKVVGEDVPLCESVQRGLESGFLAQGVLHPEQESALFTFQRRIADCLTGVTG